MLDRIAAVLQSCTTSTPHCPPQTLYNARWLLWSLLDWFATHPIPAEHPLAVPPDGSWYTDVRLRTPFRKRHQGDQLAGKRLRVDGVIGHFEVTQDNKRPQLVLRHDAQCFTVLAARLFKSLGGGTRATPYFDEAARTVTAIAETLRAADRYPVDMQRLGLYVLAPQSQIALHTFAEHVNREAIRQKTKQRVDAYGKPAKAWYKEWFQPTLEQITIETLSWEALLATIAEHDPAASSEFARFYQQCLEFN